MSGKKKHIIYRFGADTIFLVHLAVVLLGLFGWLFPKLWLLYIIGLSLALVSELILGYCLLSKWEFDLRKKINPHVDYDYTFSTHYTHKLTTGRISNSFFAKAAALFLTLSIGISLYFHFFFK